MKTGALGLFLVFPLFGQTPSMVTSMGYAGPRPVAVAPGQVITLFVRTATRPEAPIVADGANLPTSLGGFSVSLAETFSRVLIAVPILSVSPFQTCPAVIPEVCSAWTAITVQIPYELIPNVPRARLPENFATLTVSENGNDGEPIALNPVSDRIHILNSCDTPLNAQSGPCQPVFLHGDGSAVSSESPAATGETITLRAYGLGYADDQVVTGAHAPSPALTVSGVAVDLRFGADAVAGRPGAAAKPMTAQLVPGAVGLYEIAFPVPMVPEGTAACSSDSNNLTVVIRRTASFDGASLCVAVAQ